MRNPYYGELGKLHPEVAKLWHTRGQEPAFEDHPVVEPVDPIQEAEDKERLAKAWHAARRCGPRAEAIVIEYYVQGRTLRDIGEEYGRSVERIRQVMAKFLRIAKCSEVKR